jgi:predicted RNA binding protein YcfA (HicA-like mRNA interferase family)
MGRLSGFKYYEIVHKIRRLGWAFDRHAAGSHEIWRNIETGRKVVIPRHSRDVAEGTLRAILREAGIDVEKFLSS